MVPGLEATVTREEEKHPAAPTLLEGAAAPPERGSPTRSGTGELPPPVLEPPPEWYIASYTSRKRTFVLQQGLLREKGGTRTLEDVTETLITQVTGLWFFNFRLHVYKFNGKVDSLPKGAKPYLRVGNLLTSPLNETIFFYAHASNPYLLECERFQRRTGVNVTAIEEVRGNSVRVKHVLPCPLSESDSWRELERALRRYNLFRT